MKEMFKWLFLFLIRTFSNEKGFALITKPNTFTAGTTIIASEHNDNFDTSYNDYNGNITNANISGSAAIADSKLAQITTGNKVAVSAIVEGDLSLSGVILPETTAKTTAAGEMAIYSKDTSGQPETFIRNESDGTEVQVTDSGQLFGFGSYTTVTDTSTADETTGSATYVDTTLTTTFTPGRAGICFFNVTLTDDSIGGVVVGYALTLNGTPVMEVATKEGSGDNFMPVGMSYATNLAASSQTIKVQFKTASGTATMKGTVATARLITNHPA